VQRASNIQFSSNSFRSLTHSSFLCLLRAPSLFPERCPQLFRSLTDLPFLGPPSARQFPASAISHSISVIDSSFTILSSLRFLFFKTTDQSVPRLAGHSPWSTLDHDPPPKTHLHRLNHNLPLPAGHSPNQPLIHYLNSNASTSIAPPSQLATPQPLNLQATPFITIKLPIRPSTSITKHAKTSFITAV
jgi:hypothetical protein